MTQQFGELEFFRLGLYTVSDVARLTGINATRISRWVKGYKYGQISDRRTQEPVWPTEIPQIDHAIALSFNDLLEVRFVSKFREMGVGLPKIRKAITHLQNWYQTPYPFSARQVISVLTDGKDLAAEVFVDDGEIIMVDLSTSRPHLLIKQAALTYLTAGYTYDEQGSVSRWYPHKREFSAIVIDPTISFGRPVIDGTRINTSVLAAAYDAEQSIDKVANWFGIQAEWVSQSVSFHERYRAA